MPDVAYSSGRSMPERSGGWPDETARWWATVSTMPHAVLWTESDWQFAADTALVAAGFHEGELKLAGELRIREKVLGTTADSRRDLRIRYVDSLHEEDEVLSLEEYKRRLGAS